MEPTRPGENAKRINAARKKDPNAHPINYRMTHTFDPAIDWPRLLREYHATKSDMYARTNF